MGPTKCDHKQWYLVTEEMKEQDYVYGQTDRQTDRQKAGVTTNNDPRRIMTGGSLFYVEK